MSRVKHQIKIALLTALFVVASQVGIFCQQASAAWIPNFPDVQPFGPDMSTNFSSLSYIGGTMTAVGRPMSFKDPLSSPAPYTITGTNPDDFVTHPVYSLLANFDGSGNFLAGTLSVLGYIPTFGIANSGLLLSGTIEQVGYGFPSPGSATFQLVVGNLSGDLASFYGDGKAYVKLTAIFSQATSTYDGDFADDWGISSAFSLKADTIGYAVPEPASAHLLVLAIGGLFGWKARRNRKMKESC